MDVSRWEEVVVAREAFRKVLSAAQKAWYREYRKQDSTQKNDLPVIQQHLQQSTSFSTLFAAEKLTIFRRGTAEQTMSHAEMHSKVERLAMEVKQAFEQLGMKESKIEAQKTEIEGLKGDAVATRRQLVDLASENEKLKLKIQAMTSDRDRYE